MFEIEEIEDGRRYDTAEFVREQFFDEVMFDELREDREMSIMTTFPDEIGLQNFVEDYKEMIEAFDYEFDDWLGRWRLTELKVVEGLSDGQIRDICHALKNADRY